MTKTLKLRIAKFNELLVIEQLEMTGVWKDSEHVRINDGFDFFIDYMDLLGDTGTKRVSCIHCDNAQRDEYFETIMGWITKEQFGGTGWLEIGRPCLVRDNDADKWEERIYAGKTAEQLGLDKRHLAYLENRKDEFFCWEYAKPVDDCLDIEGEIYTWELKEEKGKTKNE